MATSPPRHTILLFCKFLNHRVRTDNLDVLYLIAVEFLEEPPCFTRVEDMLYRVYPAVAILPNELPDMVVRAKADRLLQRMREQSEDQDEENELRDLHSALRDRVELANWNLLERIYSEFKAGCDRTLREFVALQPEAIAILPVCPSTCLAPGAGHNISDARRSSTRQTSRMKDEIEFGAETRSDNGAAGRGIQAYRKFDQIVSPVVTAMLDVVRTALDDIEAAAPWDRVYDLSNISCPFDGRKHPALAQQLAAFWRHHARAAWQRNFWCRVPDGDRDAGYRRQRTHDRVATSSFEATVMTPLFNVCGAEFFAHLDAQPKQHDWWWYCGPIVDLVHMAGAKGTDYCIRYMKTQAAKRHPTPHPQFQTLASLHDCRSPSMWATSNRMKHMHDAAVRLTIQILSRASRKRTRAVHADSEETDEDE